MRCERCGARRNSSARAEAIFQSRAHVRRGRARAGRFGLRASTDTFRNRQLLSARLCLWSAKADSAKTGAPREFRRRVQSNGGFPRCKFAGLDYPPRSATPRFQRRSRGNQEWCRVILSASSFAFSRRHALLQRRYRLSFVIIKLHDTEKVLRGVIQCQSRGEIVADKQKISGVNIM